MCVKSTQFYDDTGCLDILSQVIMLVLLREEPNVEVSPPSKPEELLQCCYQLRVSLLFLLIQVCWSTRSSCGDDRE